MRALLDVNVLLALLDAGHADHTRARAWLAANIDNGWASCAITQNGFVRVLSQPTYPHAVSPAVAIGLLSQAASTEHHAFWTSEVSVLDPQRIHAGRVHGPRQVTDIYLLALAVAMEGRFVTIDGRVPLGAVPGATKDHLIVI